MNLTTDNILPEPALLELIHDFARGRPLEVTARSLGRDPSLRGLGGINGASIRGV
jgi:hypothetical protein